MASNSIQLSESLKRKILRQFSQSSQDTDNGLLEEYYLYLSIENEEVIGPLHVFFDQVKHYTENDIRDMMVNGLSNRSTSGHNMNEFSSRSHSMLTLKIESEQPDSSDENQYITKHGKLTFVDLAGSEKVKDTNTTGDQLLETNNINKSLLVLGKCISALGDAKKRNGHIPYRDSKLTKLLADSIGGSGVTLMIACVNPSSSNQGETMNTLRYATRAKKIQNKPVVKMDPHERLIANLKKEIKVLRSENLLLRDQKLSEKTSRNPKDESKPTKGKGKQPNPAVKAVADKNDDKKMTNMESFALENTDLYEMLQEYMIENEALRSENSDMLESRNRVKREQQYILRENDRLQRKIEELERYILTSNHAGPNFSHSYDSTRQNSWHDTHSALHSASSGSTLRSYRSVPDIYHAVSVPPYNGHPISYPHPNSPQAYKMQPYISGLPPMRYKTPPPNNQQSYNGGPFIRRSQPGVRHPHPPVRQGLGGNPIGVGPPNNYTQRFEVSKSLGARNAFQHSPNGPRHAVPIHSVMSSPHHSILSSPLHPISSPVQPMKALPHNHYNYSRSPAAASQNYARSNNLNGANGQPVDVNDQLRRDLMVLEGEIKTTQEVLTGIR